MAKEESPPKEDKSEISAPDEKKISDDKNHFSIANIVILLILLALGGVFLTYFLTDTSEMGNCESDSQCRPYNVFYFKGSGYVCASEDKFDTESLKSRAFMFKYASSNAVDEKPEGCSCQENKCEIN